MRFTSQPSTPQQVLTQFWVEGTPFKLSTTVTTGVIASDVALSPNTATTAFSKYNTVFLEYRAVRIEVSLLPVDTNPGSSIAFITERDAGTPTYLDSFEIGSKNLINGSQKESKLVWTPRGPDDSEWILGGSTSTKCYFNLYTDNANMGSPAVVTALWIVRPRFLVQFRGLSST